MTDPGWGGWVKRRRQRAEGTKGDEPSAQVAERRQMTVMFVDLVGSTAMAERHEPEVVRDVVLRYQQVCGHAIGSHGGQIANYLGDGVIAYFGFPAAREDDAREAVHSGLQLLRDLDALAGKIRAEHGIETAARVGIHTGLVLITEMGTRTRPDRDAIVGSTPNEAARIQSVAPPGAVAISEATHEIVRGYFDVESLGRPAMKGLSPDVQVFRVLGPTRAADRLQAAGRALTPLVGRSAELRSLCTQWEALGDSHGARVRIAVLRGEAGIGKSRIAGQFEREALDGIDCTFRAMCSANRTASPFYPVVRMLEARFGFEPGDDEETRLGKLEQAAATAGLNGPEAVPLLADLLEVPTAGRHPQLELDGRAVRELTFRTIIAFVLAGGDQHPTLLIVEDLHWSDQSTLELITRLGATAPAAGLLVLGTSRPEFQPPWEAPLCLTIPVERLPPSDHRELIRQLADMHELPEDCWSVIAERSDGNPLFTEELVRSLGGAVEGAGRTDTIPRTIRDLLTARLDALGPNKRLAQMAATIGRDVDTDVLRSVANLPRRQLSAGLTTLVRAGILEEMVQLEATVTHRFVHALVRDAAYDSQERLHDRRAAHLGVARALVQRGDPDAGVIAQHFDAADSMDNAVPYYMLAASSAQRAAAHVEAMRLLDRALDLTLARPADPSRDADEINIRILRGFSTVSTQGYATPAAAEDYRRGLELSEGAGADIALYPATVGIWAYYVVHGDFRAAREATERLQRMIRPEIEPEILGCTGVLLFFEGSFREARSYLEAAIEAFERTPGSVPSASWPLPNDSMVAILTILGVVLWMSGKPEESEAAFERACRRAGQLPFPMGPFSLLYALSYSGWVANLDDQFGKGLACQERVLEISQAHGFVFWTATSSCHAAISRAHLGKPDAAVDVAAASIAGWRALGAEAFVPCMQTHVAQIRLDLGQVEEALAIVDSALGQAEQAGELFFLAESHRVRAAVLRRRDGPGSPEVRAELEQSRRIAAAQGALMFELRALSDLVALDQRPEDVESWKRLVERLPVGWRPPLPEAGRPDSTLSA